MSVLLYSSSGFQLFIDFCYLVFLYVLDQDRYAHPERDRDRGSDRSGRRGDSHRGGRQQAPPPQSQPQDDRRSREGFPNIPTGPRAERSKGSTNQDVTMSAAPMLPPPVPTPEPAAAYIPPMTETDLSAIRSRYLGVDKKKRKIRKMNDRKFVFDWDAQDDTFAEDSPVAIGSNRQGAQVMFGRGRLAGMDDGGGTGPRRGSNNNNNSNGAAETQLADQRERRKAEKTGFDDRHWTEKPLEDMKERDWRIFREDFSISARGQSV